MTPKLSIIIPFYDVRGPLRGLLESLCRSDFADFEVCLCDDGSRDGSLEEARAFADRLDLKWVVHEANLGVTRARNSALALAGAPLLLFLDADVRVAPDVIARLLETRERTQADVLCGIYSGTALDAGFWSGYYALFVHHSFLVADEPAPYNVFNGWCALCRREVMDALAGHRPAAKGVEIENEALGRRIVARGFRLLLDPSAAVDHHWGGPRKILFIFTSRVYWWVKVFFATGGRFEKALTTRGYAAGTLAVPAALAFALAGRPLGSAAALAVFLYAYGPFLSFARRRRGLFYAALCAPASAGLAVVASASACFSAAEELALRLARGRVTLSAEEFS
ncbi:MAG: glycosyltransferase family 2 protein [Elusimicrobia bacterium]|nr:glycosyltransferase family 2 protein [Elusimicrobiota bacterium]